MLTNLLPVWTISFQDETGSQTTIRGTFKSGYTAAEYIAFLGDLAPKVQQITTCAVVRYAVTYRMKDTDTGKPNTRLPNTNLANFSFFLTPDPTIYEVISTPLLPSLLQTTGPLAGVAVDLTQSDVINYTDEITNSIWCDPFADDIGSIYTAYAVSVV